MLIILLLANLGMTMKAQNSILFVGRNSTKKAVLKLSSSLENEMSDPAIARAYEELAKTLVAEGEYKKAFDYLVSARKLFEKLDDKEKIARVDREMAKIYEMQKKVREAIISYTNAARLSQDTNFIELNKNDVNRLKNLSNPAAQSPYIQRNIELLNSEGICCRSSKYMKPASHSWKRNGL